MLLLKLISPIIVFLIAIGKDIFDDNIKKRKGFKPLILILMALALVVSLVSTFLDHKKNVKERLGLKESNDSLLTITNKLSKDGMTNSIILNAKIDELNSKLDPFIRVAAAKYPNKSIKDALLSLSNDIGDVKELATRDIYKSQSSKDEGGLIASLKVLRGKYKSNTPVIKFYVVQGNANRYNVIVDIIDILNRSGFKAQLSATGLFPQGDLQNGIEVHTNSQYGAFVDELFMQLRKYYEIKIGIAVRDSKEWQGKGSFPSGEIQIYVYGTPQFYNDGKVKM